MDLEDRLKYIARHTGMWRTLTVLGLALLPLFAAAMTFLLIAVSSDGGSAARAAALWKYPSGWLPFVPALMACCFGALKKTRERRQWWDISACTVVIILVAFGIQGVYRLTTGMAEVEISPLSVIPPAVLIGASIGGAGAGLIMRVFYAFREGTIHGRGTWPRKPY